MSLIERFYLFIFCCALAIPINFGLNAYQEMQKTQKEQRINDSLTKVKTKLEIDLLKKELKKYKHEQGN